MSKNNNDPLNRLKRKEGYERGMVGLADKMTAWEEQAQGSVSTRAYEISQSPENTDPVTTFNVLIEKLLRRN